MAIHDDRGALVAWLPLASFAATADGLTTSARVPLETPLAIAVATTRDTARTSYVVRALLGADATVESVTLAAALQDVAIRATAADRTIASALRITRADDAEWTPRHAFVNGVRLDEHGIVRLRLGSGRYEVRPWAEGNFSPLAITVPGPAEVDADFAAK